MKFNKQSRTLAVLLALLCLPALYAQKTPTSTARMKGDARTLYFRMQVQSDTTPPLLKLSCYDSLIKRMPAERAALLLEKASVMREMHDRAYSDTALLLYEQICRNRTAYPLRDYLEAKYTLSNLYLERGNLPEALKTTEQLLSTPMPDSLNYFKVKGYLSLANIFVETGDNEKLGNVVDQGLMWADRIGDTGTLMKTMKGGLLSRKAHLMAERGEINQAISLYQEAMETAPVFAPRIGMSLGVLFSEQNQHDIAYRYYEDALSKSDNPEIRATAAYNIARGYVMTGRHADFFRFIDRHDSDLAFFQGQLTDGMLWDLKSEAYENLGDFRQALYAQRMADSIRNTLMTPEKIREMEQSYNRIEMQGKEDEIRRLRSRAEHQTLATWVLATMAIALACLLAVQHRRLRKSRIRQIEQRGDFLREREEWEAEKKNRDDRETELEASVELRGQEKASMALRLASVSEKLEALREAVENPKARKSEIVGTVRETLREMNSEGEVWDTFMGYFEGVNQTFFDRLHRLHPDLTNAETRMCAFILLNRTNKEIAAIIHRSSRTVETIKYNLRKKLRITEPTESYLRAISSGER